MALPYLTQNIPGIGGSIKNRAEDFFVQELPLYEPSGQGEHVYCEIQKIGLTTFDAIHRIADLALKSVPELEAGILFVERQFGVIELHSTDRDLVDRAGNAILDPCFAPKCNE